MTSTITVQYSDGLTSTYTYSTREQFFYDLAYYVCFGEEEKVISAIYEGENVYYCGWQPDMLFEFKNRKGEIVYSNHFPYWEH